MNAGLDNAHRKWDRAGEHLEALTGELSLFRARDSVDLEAKRNGDRTQEWWIVHIRQTIPPTITLLIGDVVHNLRSALDHLVYALATLKGPPHRGTAFPVCTKREKFFERTKGSRQFSPSSGMNKITGLRPLAQTFIERCQPYHGGNGSGLLISLNALENTDKHRTLDVAHVIPQWWGHDIPPGVELKILRTTLVDSTPFALATYQPTNTEAQLHHAVAPDVGFPLTSGTAEASALMKQIRWKVETILWEVRPLFGLPNPTDPIDAIYARQAHHRPL